MQHTFLEAFAKSFHEKGLLWVRLQNLNLDTEQVSLPLFWVLLLLFSGFWGLLTLTGSSLLWAALVENCANTAVVTLTFTILVWIVDTYVRMLFFSFPFSEIALCDDFFKYTRLLLTPRHMRFKSVTPAFIWSTPELGRPDPGGQKPLLTTSPDLRKELHLPHNTVTLRELTAHRGNNKNTVNLQTFWCSKSYHLYTLRSS